MKLLCIRPLQRTVKHAVDGWIVLRVEGSSVPVVDQLGGVRGILFLHVQISRELSRYRSEMYAP